MLRASLFSIEMEGKTCAKAMYLWLIQWNGQKVISIPLFLVDSESGRCSWHHVPNLNFHLKRLNNGLQENSEAETTDDETASPRTRRRRNRR